MKYENGFYIYTPNDAISKLSPLFSHQVLEIDSGNVYFTGGRARYDVEKVKRNGTIGKMVMNDKGEVLCI